MPCKICAGELLVGDVLRVKRYYWCFQHANLDWDVKSLPYAPLKIYAHDFMVCTSLSRTHSQELHLVEVLHPKLGLIFVDLRCEDVLAERSTNTSSLDSVLEVHR